MSEFRSEYPRGFFISTLIPCPMDKIQWLSIFESSISENFKFRFIVNSDWQRWGLNMIRDQIRSCWFQHGNVEYWVYSTEAIRKS